ncbi:aminopeptidase N-like [Saccoglossus kowalevskii]|uniref:glutamyl aminopeptidase n=1 Tax=Saccoglossus kowalevskii TaxID=10224 RepID=A0ABM0LXU5_SACKO|nr:PREDICTED: aminopeptidase N-like [Saccoglossus kowalevskii]
MEIPSSDDENAEFRFDVGGGIEQEEECVTLVDHPSGDFVGDCNNPHNLTVRDLFRPRVLPNECVITRRGCYATSCKAALIITMVIFLFVVSLISFAVWSDHHQTSALPALPHPPNVKHFDGRLPMEVKPVNYKIQLTPYLDEDDGSKRFQFDGEVTILLHCLQATNTITLHSLNLAIDVGAIRCSSTNKTDGPISVVTTKTVVEYDFFIIVLDQALTVGHQYSINLNYFAKFTVKTHKETFGFYRSSYVTNGETRHIASTQLEYTDARRVFPCFDEPALKATFDIAVKHRIRRSTVLSNMPNIRNETIGDWNTAYFNTTPVMSNYLIAVVVTDFECKETITPNGVKFRVCADEQDLDAMEFALNFGSRCLSYFEEFWGVLFPLPKLDMISLPSLSARGMENWGLITYQDYLVLYDSSVHSPSQLQTSAHVISHELVHMWFGDFVAPSWWDELWLSEGFARFYQNIGVNHIYPQWQNYEQFYQEIVTFKAFGSDSSLDSPPTVRPVGWKNEIDELFGVSIYERAASLIRMIESFLDKDVFHSGIMEYLKDNLYNNTEMDDLWIHLSKQANAGNSEGHINLKMIMDPWFRQVGYPIVMATRENNAVTVQQKRFLLNPHEKATMPGKYPELGPWSIPLTYIHSAWSEISSLQWTWFSQSTKTFDLTGISKTDWFLLNVNQTGYYRVNYDADNWRKLIEQLNMDHTTISIQNRAALVDDVLNIAQSQDISVNTSLQLLEYLTIEMDYAPWQAAESAIKYIDNMLKRTEAYQDFRRMMTDVIKPMYSRLGWSLTTQNIVQFHNAALATRFACYYGNSECILEAQKKFSEWLNDRKTNFLIADVRQTVLCHGLMYGNSGEDWETVFSLLVNATDGPYSDDLKYGLACSGLPWKLQSYMAKYMQSEDLVDVVNDVRDASILGYYLAWDYVVSNFDEMKSSIGEDNAYGIIWSFADSMNTQADREKYEDFGNRYHDMSNDHAIQFYKGLQQINTNIEWMAKNYDDVVMYLKDRT